MSLSKRTFMLIPLALAAAQLHAQEQPPVTVVPVAPGVTMLMGPGGNIGVSSGKDGLFLIDDQVAPVTDQIRAALKTIQDGPVRFVLNTHWHPDHTGGNENLGSAGALIVAHDNVRTRLSVDQFIEALNMPAPALPEGALPVVTFTDAVTFHVNGGEIHAFHVPPAHTDGDAIVHFRTANVIHAGDTYFNGLYPLIDLSTGGSVDGTIAAANRMLAMADDDTKIIPGHGPLSNKQELMAYRDMLVTVRDRVQQAVAQGKTLEETVAAGVSKEFDEQWGKAFIPPDLFVKVMYKGVVGSK
ncbi:MAG: MBL fold metallo-hydrolase [Gemmatimonadales bacterium]|nr:MAG: MBL fold metallo-hydrolase [Gemmatimonadales bacterium]